MTRPSPYSSESSAIRDDLDRLGESTASGAYLEFVIEPSYQPIQRPREGMIVYAPVILGGGITSVGFWGYHAGAWVKFH